MAEKMTYDQWLKKVIEIKPDLIAIETKTPVIKYHWEIIKAGSRVDQITPKDAIVVAPYNGDTAFLYQTNRQGFSYIPFPIKDLIDRYNATYYVSVNYDEQTNAIMSKYTVIEKTPEFVIVKLVEPKP